MRKGAALVLVLAMAFSLCACAEIKLVTSMGDDELVSAGSWSVSSQEGIFRLMELIEAYGETDEYFFERSVGDMTMEEYLKESVKEEMTQLLCALYIADEMAIYLTDEELEEADEEAAGAYTEISAKYSVSSYGVTLEDAKGLYEKQALYDKVYSELTDSVTMEISETDTKVIEVNFILFPEETSISDAESFRNLILNGADLEESAQEAGYEVYMNITLKKGDMITAFENVAFALTDGELSECTQTVDGIYLIECVEDYLEAESAANYNSVISDAKTQIIEEAFSEVYESVQIDFNTKFWNSIDAAEL